MSHANETSRAPTPVCDGDLERAVRQATAAIVRVEDRLERIELLTKRSVHTRSLAVAFGTLVALVAFAVVGALLAEAIGIATPF